MKIRLFNLSVFILLITLGYLTRFPLVDDAYITFRYSEQLRQFGELSYNSGEHVLGTTAWLWAVVVGIARMCGVSYEWSSVAISLLATICVPSIILHFLAPIICTDRSIHTLLLVPSILFFPLLHMTATSGMESSFYVFITLAAFAADARRRPILVALLSAIAIGLRPDGILVPMAVALTRMWREPRYTITALVMVGVMIMPWLLWSTWYFGSPVPHSVVAKQMIHPSSPLQTVKALMYRFNRSDLEVLLNIFGVIGMIRILRYPVCRAPILWLVLYLLGLVFSGVDPLFFWYAAPWWIWILTFGTIGFIDLAAIIMQGDAPLQLVRAISVGVCGLCCIQSVTLRAHALERFENMRMYREVLPSILAAFTPNDSMYLCEIGFLGFSLPTSYVIDSAGIVSPQVLDLVAIEDRAERSKVVLRHERAVEKFRPTWYVSLHDICSAKELEARDWFKRDYTLVATSASPSTSRVVVYKRTSG